MTAVPPTLTDDLLTVGDVMFLLTVLGWMLVCVLAIVLAVQSRAHTRSIRALHKFYRTALKAIGNTQTFGTPTPPAATSSHVPDAEERVTRMVSEATMERGIARLRAEYEAAGIGIPEYDVLKSQVLSMLGGNEPVVEGLPRD